jgi:hypothetical protein
MSALANNFKKNFAGLLRGLLRKVDNGDSADPQLDHRPLTHQPMAATAPGSRPANPATTAATAGMQSIPDTFPAGGPARSANLNANASELEMPLLPILEKLPADLRSKWMLGGVDLQQATISVPVKKVLPQLALGTVKITFGELRTAAPTLFRTGEEYDSLPIALPLNEVLARLNPQMIPRNPGQRTVTAPPMDIAEPFGPASLGAALSNATSAQTATPAKPATTHFYKKPVSPGPIKMPTPPPVAGQPLPFVPRATPAAPPPPPAAPAAPAKPAPASQPLPFTPRATTPAAPPTPMPRVNFNPGNGGNGGNGGNVFQTPPPATPPTRNVAPTQLPPGQLPPSPFSRAGAPTSIPPTFAAKPPTPVPPPTPSPIPMSRPVPAPVPVPAPAQAPVPAQEAPGVIVALSALCEEWPEPLRLEIAQLDLFKVRVTLANHLIEPALRRGRVVFTWQQVRSWIKPTPPVSVHDNTEVELPLKTLLPLFMPTAAKKPQAASRSQAEVPPSSVPNLFFGFPQPQPEEMAPPINMPDAVPLVKPLDAKLNDSNFYVWGENGEDPHLDETEFKRAAAPATDFSSRRAMPDEIIVRAMKLPGVMGAIIALGDGLKVAHQLPAEINADTVAAFLPQLFSRVGQCSKELRMGDLNNLNFTLGNIPWKIFRVNAVYFAAFGTAGVSLPTAQLAMLAGELDRKK